MRPQQAEPLAVAGGYSHRVAGGAAGVDFVASQDRGFPHVGQRGLDVGVRQADQILAGGAVCVQSRQALLHIAAVPFEMPRRQRLDGGAVFALEVAAGGQMIGQALAPIKCPSLERGQELTLVNDSVLKCDQSHEEMAVGGDGSHETSLQASEAACLRSIPRDGSLRAALGPHRMDYLTTGRRSQPPGQIVLSVHLAGPSRRLIDPAMGGRPREGAMSGLPRSMAGISGPAFGVVRFNEPPFLPLARFGPYVAKLVMWRRSECPWIRRTRPGSDAT